MKKVLVIVLCFAITGCSSFLAVVPTSTATITSTLSPTLTPTMTATATLTPTPTPKIGTVYLDPEYDLNDRVKIIEANQEALWKYTTESFMMLNSYGEDGKGTDSYMKKLAESVGIDFNDKTALLDYLKNNDIPTEIDGVKFMYVTRERAGNGAAVGIREINNDAVPISLAQVSIQIVEYEEYKSWATTYQDLYDQTIEINANVQDHISEIHGGLVPTQKNGHLEFVYFIVNIARYSDTSYLGIPEPHEAITAAQVDKLNTYLGSLPYMIRALVIGQDSYPFVLTPGRLWGFVALGRKNREPGINSCVYFFRDMIRLKEQIPDFPPDFIEP